VDDYHSIKLRLGMVGCFVLGGILIAWAVLEKQGAVGFGDLYPGVAAVAAGLLIHLFLNYQDRAPGGDRPSAEDSDPGSSPDA
jgi:hypothetical protein